MSSQVRAPRAQPTGSATRQSPLEVEVVDLAGLGDGVARLPSGEAVLIPLAVPGDRVQISAPSRRQGVLRAQIVKLLTASPDRVSPPCPVADRCGGCGLQHVMPARQRRFRAGLAERALQPLTLAADADAALAGLGGGAPLAWRRRARLHLRRQGGQLRVGLMAARSAELVALERCPQLVAGLDAWLPRLRAFAAPFVEEGELLMTLGDGGALLALHVRLRSGAPAPSVAALEGFLAETPPDGGAPIVGLQVQAPGLALSVGAVRVALKDEGDATTEWAAAGGFCQASVEGNIAIRAAVRAGLRELVRRRGRPFALGLDLFSGSGNLTPLLLDVAGRVRSVELDIAAVERAEALHGAVLGAGRDAGQLELTQGDAESLPLPGGGDTLWLLDPGRQGAKGVCEQAAWRQPAGLVYVSCAPNTLRRDLQTLAAAGYRRVSASWVDTMPHTHHFEVVVAMIRADAAFDRS